MRDGEYVLDSDGAHWVDALTVRQDAPGLAPDGPRTDADGATDNEAYDQSPYPAPASYVRLNDVPWGIRPA